MWLSPIIFNLKNFFAMNTNQTFDAVVLTVSDEAFPKSNGKFFTRCTVEFKSGPLAGKRYFAQRTLGESKAIVNVGQSVKCILSYAEQDGVKRPFFEISTSMVDSVDDIMSLLSA
jgi:hypothetical protein